MIPLGSVKFYSPKERVRVELIGYSPLQSSNFSYIPKQIENLWKFDTRSYYAIVGGEKLIKLRILQLE